MILVGLYLSAYFVGAIPFAVLLGRMKGVDILQSGSGNPGMTNVWRTLGPKLGMLCFLLDIFKGLLPSLLARMLIRHPVAIFDPELLWFLAGVVALIGHCWSVFLKFKGGKAVSTSLGAILGTSPLVGLSCLGVFLVALLLTRYVALSSMIAVASVMVLNRLFPGESIQLEPIFAFLTALVLFRHRANIRRLIDRSEPKVKLSLPALGRAKRASEL